MSLDHPRSARLLRPRDFARLRESGRRLGSRNLNIQYRERVVAGARLGMAVSLRVSKRAVERNRIRRQIRESFRAHRAGLPACDILVIARQSAVEQSNAQLRAELETLWARLAAQAGGIER
ncbi:MAG: ribonuclease P protein component [Xanthomonadaceae bacterium]|nr:ribonuclease P protein component [Xanthomonadaceae bacterium]MDE1885518.1 ribonuclease P protein component [Xanthomonadaceae bacterium]MDE1961168.1 ribonuclease P protein component [Xanthomonadaceae bacterium]MDE2083502.1 ribonuclease P protein component [Xanthomonadaceae bacterium]MDE2256383.1 ribonuclease P protein component [Xanthomonadaceae bacterium]